MKVKVVQRQCFPRFVVFAKFTDDFSVTQYRQLQAGKAVNVAAAIGAYLIKGGWCIKVIDKDKPEKKGKK